MTICATSVSESFIKVVVHSDRCLIDDNMCYLCF